MSKTPAYASLADEILALDDTETELVTVPQWKNKKILCKSLTGKQRATIQKMLRFSREGDVKGTEATSADIVIMGAYDPETDQRVFNQTHREALLEHNSAPLELLGGVINRLSGITPQSAREAEKN